MATERRGDVRFDVAVPVFAVRGHPEWIKAKIDAAKGYATLVETDARPLVERVRELQEMRAWETWFADEPRTWERFCREALGYEPGFIEAVAEGVAILEAAGHEGPVTAAEAIAALAAVATPLAQHGEIGNGRERESRGYSVTSKRGNAGDYLTRRIARDHPEILERMKLGEFRSVRQAAIAAGIVKPTVAVRIDDPDAVARFLARHFSPGDIARIAEDAIALARRNSAS